MNIQDLAREPRQLGKLVRNARKRRGISQAELGEQAGLRQETISLIETGHPAAKLQTILSVLAALDLELRIVPRSKFGAADIEKIFSPRRSSGVNESSMIGEG